MVVEEIVQLVDRVSRLGENLGRVELGENTRPAGVGQPDTVTVSTSTALAAARSAAMREILQRGKNALTAWKVLSWTRAAPPGPAGAGCQSRHGVAVTTPELAARKIGQSEVGAPAGEFTITGCGATAAIDPRGSREGKRRGRKPPRLRVRKRIPVPFTRTEL